MSGKKKENDSPPFIDSPPPSPSAPLSRSGRRASISMPQGLDLLIKIAEYSWQNKPPINSSFDDLADAGIADACPSPLPPSRRRVGQVAGPSRGGLHVTRQDSRTNYEPVSQSDSEISEFSEVESPIEVSPPPGIQIRRVKRVGISMDPKGRKSKKSKEPEDDTIINLRPLASRRHSGVLPLKIRNSNYLKSEPDGDVDVTDDDDVDPSKATSPTPSASATSFSSIIRDKLHSVPIPGIFRKKKPEQYKIQAFVAILFLTIILLVGSIYVIHQEKILQRSYYDRIRFSSKDRRFLVSNLRGRDVLAGILGVNLSKRDKAWPCLAEDERENKTCMEWMNKARLYLRTKQNLELPALSFKNTTNLRCYEIFWQSLHPDFEPKDCFKLGDKLGGHFYGGGEIPGKNNWPLNKTRIPYGPFLTGGGSLQWGRTLRRFFINSDGASLQISEDTPLHVSINDGDDRLCIGSRVSPHGFDNEGSPLLLNYTICTGENILETSELLSSKEMWDRLKHADLQVTRSLAQSPIWRILPQTINNGQSSESALLNYTDRIAALHLSEGFILLDESWQKHIGDFEMDPDRFPTMGDTLNITRRRGFKVALTIQPFFSTQSQNYEEGLGIGDGGIWLAERHPGNKKVPALTQYKQWSSVAMLDATKTSAQYWLERKVSAVVDKYEIDALYLDLGTSYDLPQFYSFSKSLFSSDHYKSLLLDALRPLQHVHTIGVSSAISLPKLPAFVALSPTETSWAGLQSIIPNILAMGIAGYPFIIPGSIGGDFFPEDARNVSLQFSAKGTFRVPPRDLYIRWLQLVHFLPVVQYSYLPSDYDQKVVELATNMHVIRKKKLSHYIKKAIDEAVTTGLPIIRPLWMMDPLDPNCLKVSDEFSIGEDIIIAPVIQPGAEERDIYLPKGIWKNEMDGSPTKGQKWLHHYRVKNHQIPFFTKMHDSRGPDSLIYE